MENNIESGRKGLEKRDGKRQRYVDMMSDAGFKAVFGDKGNKEVLADLLNLLLPKHRKVEEITYATTEIQGLTPSTRGVRFDLRCRGADGTTFIVEMQRGSQEYFFKRCISYTSKVYDAETEKGKSKDKSPGYDIPPVYLIAILEESMPHADEALWTDEVVSRYTFMETRTKEFADETIFTIFVELGRFKKELYECETLMDKWCYSFKNMGTLEDMPQEMEKDVFGKLFDCAEIAGFDMEKRLIYEKDMYTERDRIAREAFLEKKGREEGRKHGLEEGKMEIAGRMIEAGMPLEQIASLCGLTEENVRELMK